MPIICATGASVEGRLSDHFMEQERGWVLTHSIDCGRLRNPHGTEIDWRINGEQGG